MSFDRIRVLLVDDNAFARNVGQRALRAAGITSVEQAASGQAAIALLSPPDHAFDIVFCDLMMPEMDGLQFVRQAATLATPSAFVFLSGGATALLNAAEDTALARGLRVLGVIEKPLTPQSVRRVVQRLYDKTVRVAPNVVDVTPQEIDTALEKGQIFLNFQPKVAVADGNVVGFEALARWKHPERGQIPPDAFIPIAEQNGRIGPLTDRVMMLALRQCATWKLGGLRTKMNVNLSAHTLVDLDLPDRLVREVKRFEIDPRQLILEVTESGLFHDTADTLDILARLHMKGFPLSIDDFGTGYSSMEQLRRVPFAEMKIDRAFVNGAGESSKTKAILESSAELGRSLQMTVVAEGAETQEDWDAVRAAGVDLVQGYFIAKPMPAEAIPQWMAQSAKMQEARL